MDFSDVLVIKLVPLTVDDVLAVGDVVPTCNRTHSAAGSGEAWDNVSSANRVGCW